MAGLKPSGGGHAVFRAGQLRGPVRPQFRRRDGRSCGPRQHCPALRRQFLGADQILIDHSKFRDVTLGAGRGCDR